MTTTKNLLPDASKNVNGRMGDLNCKLPVGNCCSFPAVVHSPSFKS